MSSSMQNDTLNVGLVWNTWHPYVVTIWVVIREELS